MAKAIIAIVLLLIGLALILLSSERLYMAHDYFSTDIDQRDPEIGKYIGDGYTFIFFGIPMFLVGLIFLISSARGGSDL